MIKSNVHKKATQEDKFARKNFSPNAKVNQTKVDKKAQKKKFRKFLVDNDL
jgi:hypothetical protein